MKDENKRKSEIGRKRNHDSGSWMKFPCERNVRPLKILKALSLSERDYPEQKCALNQQQVVMTPSTMAQEAWQINLCWQQ